MHKLMLVVSTTAAFASIAHAATVTFSNALGDGEIANSANWPEETMPGESDIAKFTEHTTYKATNDVTFGKIVYKPTAANSTCKFDLSKANVTVTLTGNGTSDSSPAPVFWDLQYNGSKIWLIGGTWNLTGAFSIFTAGERSGCTLTITDNAKVTTAGFVMPGYQGTGSNNRIVVTNGASISAKEIRLGYVAGAHNGVLEIANGGKVSVSGIVNSETQNTVYGGKLYVHGANSCFTGASGKNVNIGYVTHDAKLLLDDGASFTCGSLYVGNRQAASGAGAYDNSLIASNSTISTHQNLYVGHRGVRNSAIVYNTPVSVLGSFRVGCAEESSSNTVRLVGAGTTLSYVSDTTAPFFGFGCFNTLSFEDGASHTLTPSDVTLSGSAHDNTIRIAGAGSALVKTGGKLFMCKSDENGYANSIVVEDGGTFQFYDMFVYRQDNKLVVSNGTIKSERYDPNSYSLTIGGIPDGSTAVTTNNALIVQGDSPKVKLAHSGIRLLNGSRLHFDIPASGVYAETPVEAVNLLLSESSALEVDCADCLAASWKGVRRMTLAETRIVEYGGQQSGGVLSVPEAVLAAANARLPKNCKVYVDGKRLVLRVSKPCGFMLIVR